MMTLVGGEAMSHIFLAYGEGEFAATATGVFLGVSALVVLCVLLGIYAVNTYPADRR
jgi:glycerol-3-phosphate acyltransferase PlsY